MRTALGRLHTYARCVRFSLARWAMPAWRRQRPALWGSSFTNGLASLSHCSPSARSMNKSADICGLIANIRPRSYHSRGQLCIQRRAQRLIHRSQDFHSFAEFRVAATSPSSWSPLCYQSRGLHCFTEPMVSIVSPSRSPRGCAMQTRSA